MTGGRPSSAVAWLIAAVTVLVALAGCDGTTPRRNRIVGHQLTIYLSLPLIGPSRWSGRAALHGAQMALAAVGDRIGPDRVRLRVLDDATKARDGWDPGQTTLNAREAIKDPTTVGYVGDLNSGASAVSIPLLNRAMVPQISPASTAVGLTEGGPQASPGEPQKYYPEQRRTFARVIPNDGVQSTVQATIQRAAGCRRIVVLHDAEVDGRDAAQSFDVVAKRERLDVAQTIQFDPTASSYKPLGNSLAKLAPDCALISALPQDNAVPLTEAVASALPHALLFATDGLAEPSFVDPAFGGVPLSLDPRLRITEPMLDAADYPPAGRRFLAAYARRYGARAPDAIFGYEAMALLLDALRRATADGTAPVVRSKVIAAIFATRDRASVLGAYGIDRDGDTSLRRFGVDRVVDGKLVFVGDLPG